MKKILQNKLLLFAIFNIIVVGALYTRCDMQEEGKKWPMKGLKKNEDMVPAHQTPSVTPTPTATPTELPTTFSTPSPEREKRILEFATFVDSMVDFNPSDKKKVREHLEKAFKLFPTKEHLKELDNQAVHFIPPEIGIAGQFLSKLIPSMRENKNYNEEGYLFLQKCSKHEPFPTTVRALCFSHYAREAKDRGDTISATGVPKQVIDLANITLGLEKSE
ncbi:MAG: hypothetical protein EP326_14310 [Deltaproteobacteria bacterium]|nr:MAG: hypothetical protein EP326_14310 [Deltaproteobacteria bacterium]